MSDPISTIRGTTSTPRSQPTTQSQALRNNPAVLSAIVTNQQNNAPNANRVSFALPQNGSGSNASKATLPRGSIVDKLA